jgi:putative ABC transport system permease protein
MIKHYLKTALRVLRRHRLFSLISIAGLALGLACCLVIIVHLEEESRFDAFHREADSLYRVVRKMPDVHGPSTRNPLGPVLAGSFPEIEAAVRWWRLQEPATFRIGDQGISEEGVVFADPGFFRMFTHRALSGDLARALEHPKSAVLTRSAARRFFGTEAAVGQTLSFDGTFDLAVTAVIDDVPRATHLPFRVLIPLEAFNEIAGYVYGYDPARYRISDDWMAGMFGTYVKLRPGVDPRALEAKFPALLKTYAPRNPELLDEALYLQPVRDIHLRSAYRSDRDNLGSLAFLRLVAAIGLVVLLMSCFNYINLATARFATRSRETGLRKTLGAGRRQLLAQFLAEAVVVVVFAFALAAVVLVLAAPIIRDILGRPISPGDFARPAVLTFAGLAGTLAVLLSGVYPALFFSAFPPLSVLKDPGRPAGRRFGLRAAFVLFQFAATIGLLAAAGVVWSQVRFLKGREPGFNRHQVVAVPVKDEAVRSASEALRAELLGVPGVGGATFASALPSRIFQSTTMDLQIGGERKVFEMSFASVDQDFAAVFAIPLAAGRFYDRGHLADGANAIVINERAAAVLGWDDPVGRELRIFGAQRTVVGVLRDFHFDTLHAPIAPLALRLGGGARYAAIRIAPRDIPATLSGIGAVFRRFAPGRIFEWTFLDEEFARFYRAEESFGRTMGYFASLAVLISSLGIFGLAFFLAERRTKEIGIRKVLGASTASIALLMSRDFARLALLANVLAWPVAWLLLGRWLRNFAYRMTLGPGLFVLAGVLALSIALLTVGSQAVRAASADPARSLRTE